MSDDILAPHGDVLVLRSALQMGVDPALVPTDALLLRRLLEDLLERPGNREALLGLIEDDPLGPSFPWDDATLVEVLAERIESGMVLLGSQAVEPVWEVRGIVPGGPDATTDASTGSTPSEPPPEPQEHVRDWYFYCHHHVAPYGDRGQKNRNAFGRVSTDEDGRPITVIDVVPDFVGNVPPGGHSDPGKDKVHFFWKDDELGSPPRPELHLNTASKPEQTITPTGGEAGYTEYAFDVAYLGGQDAILFFTPGFWREFMATTQYRLSGGPQPIRVDVYHPRKYKFELKMPPLRGYKRGVKLGEGNADPRKLAHPENLVRKMEEERSGWGPSKLPLVGDVPKSGVRESDNGLLGNPTGSFKAKDDSESKAEYGKTGHAVKGAADKLPIKFSRDDVALDPGGLLGSIAAILRLYRLIFGIIDTIKDYAPQAGFYVDFSLELMTGALAVEWMWKEFEDHRAYAAVDVNAKLTLFKVTLELGVGVSAAGGKLQVFAQVEGSTELSLSYCRTSPDGDAQIPFAFKAAITGAIGARAEAGSFVKLEGKGETGFELEFKATVGIGNREPPFKVEITPTWTGISFTGTFSAAAFGISYEKTGKYELVTPKSLPLVAIPSDKPYEPPHMSKHDIARVFRETFYKGTNVLFYREGEHRDAQNHCSNPACPGHGSPTHYCNRWDSGDWGRWMDLEPVCDQLAEAVMADKGFTQTPRDIEALANSVRVDFRETSKMARSQMVGRNYVDYWDAQAYIAGRTVRGCSLKAHLARGQQDPMLNQRVGP
ncbi:MAG: hypothetical protein KC619_00670 [Myxococcales bacterium]|nr:hypothetical protein [Myxococcales bacterium]